MIADGGVACLHEDKARYVQEAGGSAVLISQYILDGDTIAPDYQSILQYDYYHVPEAQDITIPGFLIK